MHTRSIRRRAPVGPRPVPMTRDLYRHLAESPRFELIGPLCFREPQATYGHQSVADNILVLLRQYVRSRHLGHVVSNMGVDLGADGVLIPDVCFFTEAGGPHLREDGLHGVAPELCVEVLSASTRAVDRTRKAALYAAYGCREYWLIEPRRGTVEVRHLRDRVLLPVGRFAPGDTFACAAIAGLTVPVAAIFDRD